MRKLVASFGYQQAPLMVDPFSFAFLAIVLIRLFNSTLPERLGPLALPVRRMITCIILLQVTCIYPLIRLSQICGNLSEEWTFRICTAPREEACQIFSRAIGKAVTISIYVLGLRYMVRSFASCGRSHQRAMLVTSMLCFNVFTGWKLLHRLLRSGFPEQFGRCAPYVRHTITALTMLPILPSVICGRLCEDWTFRISNYLTRHVAR